MKRLLVLAALLFALPAHAEVTIEWVTVGDPGNAADITGYGAVPYEYRISKYEVTNAQYTEFLNAKAASDPLGLYPNGLESRILRLGTPGNYSYIVAPGWPEPEDWPVNYVSFYNALRFANWLHNGQGDGDTESGAYTLMGGTPVPSNGATVSRNTASATVFLPSEDEWYKAAYYDAALVYYNVYPFADSLGNPVCEVPPGTTTHSANCGGGGPVDVGAFTTSPSDYGTFDQGGNVWEWNEAIVGSERGLRGGSFNHLPNQMRSDLSIRSDLPTLALIDAGFRVASPVSAPPVPSLGSTGVALLGGLVFGIGVVGMGIAARRRRG